MRDAFARLRRHIPHRLGFPAVRVTANDRRLGLQRHVCVCVCVCLVDVALPDTVRSVLSKGVSIFNSAGGFKKKDINKSSIWGRSMAVIRKYVFQETPTEPDAAGETLPVLTQLSRAAC
jgi:hypothetical protein